ncbi:MAG: hypothetical protein WDA06_01855 [Phenylobacterium sp.]
MIQIKAKKLNEYLLQNRNVDNYFNNRGEMGVELQNFFADNLNEKITVIPADDPGKVGVLLIHGEGEKEKSFWYSIDVFNINREVKCKTYKEFNAAFNDAVAKNYYIVEANDPKRLLVGFIVLANDEVVQYMCNLNAIDHSRNKKIEDNQIKFDFMKK